MNLIMPPHPLVPVQLLQLNNDLISDHDDPNRDSGQEEGAESGNGTHQVPNKVVDEEDWQQDGYCFCIQSDMIMTMVMV